MADISDVENALVAAIDAAIYPTGDSGASACGYDAAIYRGAPTAATLDAALAAGMSHVTVYEQAGFNRLTGGYIEDGNVVAGTVTLTASVSGATATFGGTGGVGQLAGVIVDGRAYAYASVAGDTPSTIATAIAALVNGATLAPITTDGGTQITDNGGNPLLTADYATVSGPSITFATNRPIQARVAACGTEIDAVRWQVQGVRVTVWAPSTTARDALCSLIDAQLANTRFLSLPLNQSARLQWRGTFSDDVPSQELLWKRDLLYTAQFATTIVSSVPAMLFGIDNTTATNPAGTGAASTSTVA